MRSFIAECRRRRVFRVAALYIVGAWVVLQVADLAFEAWEIPSPVLRGVWIAALFGFPAALIFGWRFERLRASVEADLEDQAQRVAELKASGELAAPGF